MYYTALNASARAQRIFILLVGSAKLVILHARSVQGQIVQIAQLVYQEKFSQEHSA